MPYEKETLRRRVEQRARHARRFGEVSLQRPAVRSLEGEDDAGVENQGIFRDQSDETVAGVDG